MFYGGTYIFLIMAVTAANYPFYGRRLRTSAIEAIRIIDIVHFNIHLIRQFNLKPFYLITNCGIIVQLGLLEYEYVSYIILIVRKS